METWVPVMHIHREGEMEECVDRFFAPQLTEKAASEFWELYTSGIQFMVSAFELPAVGLAIAYVSCKHENFTDNCTPCQSWLDATVVESVIETEREGKSTNGTSHSS